jgi:lipid-A-disaccharide synthase
LEWLDHPAQVAELVDIFEELHLILKQPTQELAASAIMQTIEQSGT